MRFSNLQNHMENLSKQFARRIPRESSIVVLKLDLRNYTSKMFPVDIDAAGLWTTFAVIKKRRGGKKKSVSNPGNFSAELFKVCNFIRLIYVRKFHDLYMFIS